jgi:hypothetical protein
MGYVFGGTLAHLQSCISIGRVAAARGLATQTTAAAAATAVDGATVAAEAAGGEPAAKRANVGDTGRGGPIQEPVQHEQEQLSPKLALVSTGVMVAEARQHLQAALARVGYVFGGTLAHLQSCISIGWVAAARGLATQTTAAAAAVDGATVAAVAEAAGGEPAAKRAKIGDTGRGRPMQVLAQHEQEQLSPKLALVSHALALAVTPAPQPVGSSSTGVMGAEARQHLQAALARLAAEAAEGGCEWLQAYCDFLQRRHRLG